MIANCITSGISSLETFLNKEKFSNANGMNENDKLGNFFVVFIAFLIIVLLLSLVGQFLWNFCISGEQGLFKGASEAKSIWHILALYILISLLFGGCR